MLSFLSTICGNEYVLADTTRTSTNQTMLVPEKNACMRISMQCRNMKLSVLSATLSNITALRRSQDVPRNWKASESAWVESAILLELRTSWLTGKKSETSSGRFMRCISGISMRPNQAVNRTLRNEACSAWNTVKSAHGSWRLSNSPALYRALPNRYFTGLGLPSLAT